MQCANCAAFQFEGPLGNLADLYNQEYYTGAEYINYELASTVYRRNFERKLAIMKSHLVELPYEKMRVLEIGSATGDFLEVLRDRGVGQMYGVEASAFARAKAVERGFKVLDPFSDEYQEKVEELSPNVVCAWDVWEHLEYPANVFGDLLLKNPSVELVVLSTVDSGAILPRIRGKSWRQFHPPTHVNYPTKKSFELFFKDSKFRVVENIAFGYSRPLADYLSIFISPRHLNKVPLLFKIPLYLNLFDIQLVVAKRA